MSARHNPEPHTSGLAATNTGGRQPALAGIDQRRFAQLYLSTFVFLAAILAARTIYVGVNLGLSAADFSQAPLVLSGLATASYFTLIRFNPLTASLFAGLGLASLATMLAAQASALVMRTGRHLPITDEILAAADRLVGFHWVDALKFFDRYAYLDPVWQAAYNSIYVQAMFIVFVLAMTRQSHRMFQFLVAMTLALSVTNVVAIFFPALGPYEFFELGRADHPNIMLVTEVEKVTARIQWLRSAVLANPVPDETAGLISFPSFHAATAAIYIWALWRTPLAKWVGLVANTLMLIATPVHGVHYVCDVFAGLAVALVAVAMAPRIFSLCENQRRLHSIQATGLTVGALDPPSRKL